MSQFANTLIQWHGQFGRTGLPWQGEKDPYKVWLSEIMLQQTQVVTVIDRYQTFLVKFPHLNALASASSEEVMALWAGLGYYTRARNLHACAQKIVAEYGGNFPVDPQVLETLPGIGKSTARAIAAFCFNYPASILDANVQRVLARVYGITAPLKSSVENKKLWLLADSLLPQDTKLMPIYTQALMDFGATVCSASKPVCLSQQQKYLPCVYQKECAAHQQQIVLKTPFKTTKTKVKLVVSDMLLVVCQNKILLEKRPPSGIWGGLWSLPEAPWQEVAQVADAAKVRMGIGIGIEQFASALDWILPSQYQAAKKLAPRKHVFTHRTLYYSITVLTLSPATPLVALSEPFEWVSLADLSRIGLPTPIKQLMQDFGWLSLA